MHSSRFSRLILVFIGIGLLLLPVSGQAGAPDRETTQPAIDAYIAEQMRELGIPGLAVAIVRGNQIEYVRGYGTADASGRPVTPQTPFLIASLSKPVTALGVMQLVEEGKLRLDAPVQEYLPWFRTADPEAASQITVRNLLHHASGFSELEGYQRNLEKDKTERALEESVKRLSRSKLNSPPGEQFEYSNTNYDILGLLTQAATGKAYETYIEEHVFAPLGMENSFTSLEKARAGRAASGYGTFFGMTVDYDRFMPYSHTVLPSAGLFASAEDMARFLYAHLNQGRAQDGSPILSPAGIAELHAPGIKIGENVSYGMGWTIFPFPQAAADEGSPVPTGISHGGDWANYKAMMVMIPEQELGVVVLMNKKDPSQDSAYNNIAWNTALLALGLEAVDFPGNESFLRRYGLILGVLVVLLLAASFLWSARRLFQRSAEAEADDRRRKRFLAIMAALALIDLALAGYLLFVLLPGITTTLPLALRFEPDAGLIYLLILVFTLGWGTARTALAIRELRGKEKVSTPEGPLPG